MARNFDPSNPDYLEIGDVASLDIAGDAITVAAWVKLASTSGERKVIAKWSDSGGAFSYLLGIAGAGNDNAQFVVNTGSNGIALGTTSLSVGVWHLIVGTYDGVTVRVYLDGVEDGTDAQTGNLNLTSAPVRIGVGSGATSEQPMDGDIGHCPIWDIDLTAGEVASLAAGISPLKLRRGSLVYYAPINGQSPEADVIGGFTATVNGTPTKSEEPPIPHSIVAP